VDLNKLTTSDKVVCGSAIALLIFSFLPWYGLAGGSRNGWDYFLFGIIPVLLGLVMLAQVAITRFSPQTKLPTVPMGWGQVHLILGGIAALLVLIKLAIGDSVSVFGLGSVDLDRKVGIFLALLAGIGLAVGGYLKFQEEKAGGIAPAPGAAPPTPF
jgi:hypothetical protein